MHNIIALFPTEDSEVGMTVRLLEHLGLEEIRLVCEGFKAKIEWAEARQDQATRKLKKAQEDVEQLQRERRCIRQRYGVYIMLRFSKKFSDIDVSLSLSTEDLQAQLTCIEVKLDYSYSRQRKAIKELAKAQEGVEGLMRRYEASCLAYELATQLHEEDSREVQGNLEGLIKENSLKCQIYDFFSNFRAASPGADV